MRLITEDILRPAFKKNPQMVIEVEKGTILTPSAKQFIREKGIQVIDKTSKKIEKNPSLEVKKEVENHYAPFEIIQDHFKPKFVSAYDGGHYEKKPEYMTHLRGNQLVFKDDPRILFRGKVDSLQSTILELQYHLKESSEWLKLGLDEMLHFSREILRAEVTETPLLIESLLGLSEEEIREHSHYPKKYYGVQHFLPDVSMGFEIVMLNKLRTQVRELEIICMQTFRQATKVERNDIVTALNRMSSAVYILMCRAKGEKNGSWKYKSEANS